MIYRPRIIPILTLDSDGELICTKNFNQKVYVGDPLNAIAIFNEYSVDEIGIIDIYASREKRSLNGHFLKKISEESKTPLMAGGGVNSLDKIKELLQCGAEKVILSSAILFRKEFLYEATEEFGTSSIVVCLDVKKINSKYFIYNSNSKNILNFTIDEFIVLLEKYGLGECIVQSIDNNGEMKGYDRNLYNLVNKISTVPIIGLGGCGVYEDINSANEETSLSAYASGSAFCFFNRTNEVLINYPEQSYINNL